MSWCRTCPAQARFWPPTILYNTAPKDGATIGAFARDMALMGVLGGNANTRFDPQKFTWLGTAASGADDAYLMIARKDSVDQDD